MTSCADCIHVDVCEDFTRHKLSPSKAEEILPSLREHGKTCELFKDRSHFIELPTIDDYENAKLLDIAIDYCYKVAMNPDPNIRAEYKAEHMRLCGWLGDLRRRIEAEQALQTLKGSESNAR